MVSGCRRLVGMPKAAGLGLPAAFGAAVATTTLLLGYHFEPLGVIGLFVGALVVDQVGRFRLWL